LFVTPAWLYHPLVVIPERFYQNPNNGRWHPYGSRKKKQKRGFPIKNFGNDGKGRSSPLNGSIDYKGTPPPHKPPEKTKTQKKKRQKKTIINNPEEKPPRRHP